MSLRVDHTTTSGTFTLDGQSWDVDNNVWILGDDKTCIVFDAPHELAPIVDLIGGRQVQAIVLTHAHSDHIGLVQELRAATGAPVLLHPDDRVLWDMVYPDDAPDGDLHDGQVITLGGSPITVLHTPGHSPGGCCFYVPDAGCVFSGDTLFSGGPGATGRSFSDFDTIIESIRDRLLILPEDTKVHTGHGDSTTIGAEAPHLAAWIARGH